MKPINEAIAQASQRARRNHVPTTSALLQDGSLLEMVFNREKNLTAFALWKDDRWELIPHYELPDGRRLVPYSANNNLLVHGVVLFAAGPEEYGSEAELVARIRSFIHKYVDLGSLFERVAVYYVLLTWIVDGFNELPYLRVRGDLGTGKTRFLLTVGTLCFKPIFASGASTVSPLFRILDAMQGTLVMDESDFRVSDERAEVVKILNNGNVRGFPVLRTESVPGSNELNPKAYHVFGPKLVATRGCFDDPALESRFLTEVLGDGGLRPDIPINLPREHAIEAEQLRNQLLLFRFRNLATPRRTDEFVDRAIHPRLNQIFAPLLSVIADEGTRSDLKEVAVSYHREMMADRNSGIEAEILEVVQKHGESQKRLLSVKEITNSLIVERGSDFPQLTAKRVGWILRRKLGLSTEKSNGVYVVAGGQEARLQHLCQRYGVERARTAATAEVPEVPNVPEPSRRSV